MSVDMFLKLGDVEGESSDTRHPREIDVLAWSWGMSQPGTTHAGGGGGSGKVDVRDLSITKFLEVSPPALMRACCDGRHFPMAKLTVRAAGRDAIEYLKVTLREV